MRFAAPLRVVSLGFALSAFQSSEYQLLVSLLSKDSRARAEASEKLVAAKDVTLLAGLSDVLSFYYVTGEDMRAREVTRILREVSGESVSDPRRGWVEWVGRHEEIRPREGYLAFKAAVFALYDPSFRDFLDPSLPFRIRPEEIEWGGVKKDGIPALDYPRHVRAPEASYLGGGDKVFGIYVNGEARAYPFRIMDWHEMVNDFVGGVPVTLSYCTLCGSGILFDGRLGGQVYSFGSSGLLYRSNKLMYDRLTRSLWSNLTGEPVSGAMAGSGGRLAKLPLVVSTWEEWTALHPGTLVLSLETGHDRDYDYGRSPYEAYRRTDKLMFPVWLKDDRLSAKEPVFALVVQGRPKAYPLELVRKEGVVLDRVGGKDVVLVSDGRTEAVRAYESQGRRFARGTSPERLLEEGASAVWIVTEDALVSEGGEKLPRLAGHNAYWFGWFAFFPATELYRSP